MGGGDEVVLVIFAFRARTRLLSMRQTQLRAGRRYITGRRRISKELPELCLAEHPSFSRIQNTVETMEIG